MGEVTRYCSEKVHDDVGVGFHPCSRVGRVNRDGKWYCSQHDPQYVQKKREQRQAEYKQQLERQRVYSQVDMDAALRRAKVEGLKFALLRAEQYEGGTAEQVRDEIANDIAVLEADARAAQIEEGE